MVLDPKDYGIDFEKDSDSFLIEALRVLEDYLDSQDNDDYEINPPQFRKFLDVISTIWNLIEGDSKRIEETRLIPKECVGGWTVSFNLLWVTWGDLYRLCEVLTDACALSLDATLDGRVQFSLNVPDVFKKKKTE